MRKRTRIVLTILLLAVIGGVVWVVLSPEVSDPVFEGKKLSAWLRDIPVFLNHGFKERKERNIPLKNRWAPEGLRRDEFKPITALSQIGSNAVPTLLRMLRAKDSALKLKLVLLAQKQTVIKIDFVSAEEKQGEAYEAFWWLGAEADSAIPELIQIFDENISPTSQHYTLLTLADMGPAASAATPSIVRAMSSTNEDVRSLIMVALISIQAPRDKIVSILMESLRDPSVGVRATAAAQLGEFRDYAKITVPELIRLLAVEQEANVRDAAERSLKALDPKAAEDAGIK